MTALSTPPAPGRAPRGARPGGRARQEDIQGRLLVSPTVVVVGLVVLLPFLAVVVLAFQDLRLIDIPRITPADLEVTFDNFATVLSSAGFWTALRTTVVYATATTLGAIVAGVAVALALRRPFPGRGLVRGLVLVPYVLPVVAAATIWRTSLDTQYGVVNAFGRQVLGWEAPLAFLSSAGHEIGGVTVPLALTTVIAFEIWKTFPLAFLFVTARLQAVPGDLEEAASIDGASALQRFWYIVLPQLRGVVALLIVLRFLWSFQSFNDIYLLTGGAGGTEVLAVRVYEELITRANIGTASALGLVMTVLLSVLLVLYVRMARKEQSA
ncbi:carbohydrate ABC transporter permease [Allonocardiopsis opalescens]|uniref:Carbohydrate ABC transporter membrane protein 1 (CUT1 family) n=1 Tax=Allonocardiopsis opalescens TaxID=1144618 RepID=A0A2T0QAT3_9ACTN|nr:sugar ABC transporter permease [Allonocardiopsis opalescens]PRY00953.1 carbohydrate ABC transporter membrane protein 1 (CUT1 family) [Allonocardiopsis opalescens]